MSDDAVAKQEKSAELLRNSRFKCHVDWRWSVRTAIAWKLRSLKEAQAELTVAMIINCLITKTVSRVLALTIK